MDRLCGCRTTADRRYEANFSSQHLSRVPLGHRLSRRRIGPGYGEKIHCGQSALRGEGKLHSDRCVKRQCCGTTLFGDHVLAQLLNDHAKRLCSGTQQRSQNTQPGDDIFFLTTRPWHAPRPFFDIFSGWAYAPETALSANNDGHNTRICFICFFCGTVHNVGCDKSSNTIRSACAHLSVPLSL